jgi:perosamine synthetase
LNQGIVTKRGVMNAHRTAAYAAAPWSSSGTLRESERAEDRCLMLPLYSGLAEADQDRVAAALIEACR